MAKILSILVILTCAACSDTVVPEASRADGANCGGRDALPCAAAETNVDLGQFATYGDAMSAAVTGLMSLF